MRPSCHKNVIQWVLLATRREVGMHNGRGSAGFFLAMVLFLLAGPLAAQQLCDYGAEGLTAAAHLYDPGVFIGRPSGGPWIDGESVARDDSDGEGIQFSFNGREVTCFLSRDGVMAGWIDFDGGEQGGVDFSQAADNIIPPQPVRAGYNSFSFAWPEGYRPGQEVWARFRFSSSRQPNAVQSPAGLSDAAGEVQDYRFDLTPIALGSFEAHPENAAVRLEWQTQAENDNLGFHLFRACSEEGPYSQITRNMVRGAGSSTFRRSYEYSDSTVEPGKSYYYKLADVDYRGRMTMHGPVRVSATAPVDYVLEQIYPNPFNPETRINFRLKEAGKVLLSIFDLRGRQVRRLMAAALPGGTHTVSWNGKDDNGLNLSSDTYIYKLQVDDYEISRRIKFVR